MNLIHLSFYYIFYLGRNSFFFRKLLEKLNNDAKAFYETKTRRKNEVKISKKRANFQSRNFWRAVRKISRRWGDIFRLTYIWQTKFGRNFTVELFGRPLSIHTSVWPVIRAEINGLAINLAECHRKNCLEKRKKKTKKKSRNVSTKVSLRLTRNIIPVYSGYRRRKLEANNIVIIFTCRIFIV